MIFLSCVHATLYITASVHPSIGRLVSHWCLELMGNQFSQFAHAHRHATDAAVYTALFCYGVGLCLKVYFYQICQSCESHSQSELNVGFDFFYRAKIPTDDTPSRMKEI